MPRILSFFSRLLIAVLCLVVLASVCAWGYFHYQMHQKHQLQVQQDLQLRQELKTYCQSNHCECFNNIVDYRFSKSQVRAFLRYLQERQNRFDAQLMEFTDLQEASAILSILEICQSSNSVENNINSENLSELVPENTID